MSATDTQSATTKEFVEISDIRDTIVILKDGSLRSVIEVNSMNFELKSADEQTAIIFAFESFLNSLDFPLQIAVKSRKLDIRPYLQSLDNLTQNIQNELLKVQAVEYTRFVKGLTELANIMSKKFYVVVPFYAIEAVTATTGGIMDAFKSIFSPKQFVKSISDEELQNYKTQLDQRIGVISQGISGLGLETKVLSKDALINLFFEYYNPGHQAK